MQSHSLKQPPELLRAAAYAGVSPGAIPASQLLLVTGNASEAILRCYDKRDNGVWHPVLGAVAGHVGKNGVTRDKNEGDGCTPAGLYRLGHAFGCREKPVTKMIYRSVTENSRWVDDPKSSRYNTWAESGDNSDWSSAERLSDYPDSYAYAVVIAYNTAHISPGKGSAVFLHCGLWPTSGCVAVPEDTLLKMLRWLDPDKSPGILISKIE